MRTIYSAIFHNLFIKAIAFFLAVLTWSYIAGQLYREVPEAQRSSSAVVKIADRNVIVKTLPVHINLTGTPDKRYRVAIDRIRVYPSECIASGPLEKIEGVSFITTNPISVEGVTKSIRQQVKLKDIEGININKEQKFHVVVPVVRKRTK